jgi:hypothetical protein
MPQAYGTAITDLRKLLLEVKPSGADGFEGLVADVLADFTGLVIRLAKSGSQFGRDGSSLPAPFAIALEGKRYDDALRLEDLAGKAVVGGHVLEGRVDVWVLGATSEVGDDTIAKLTQILEGYGVMLLALDWADRPLPPLAVALAAAKDAAVRWFERYAPGVALETLANCLDTVAAHPAFFAQSAYIREQLSAAHVGLEALRRRSAIWLRHRLTERGTSQQSFGQYVTVADPAGPAVPRTELVTRLAEAVRASDAQPNVVAVLGDEGVGKTWLVAQWWASLPDAPIMLLVAGRRVGRLDPSDPVGSLARLLTEQDGRTSEADVTGWRIRLQRWRAPDAVSHPRFVLVLDGLNEQPSLPWADLIKGLAKEVQGLGGVVVATCRSAFWGRDVAPRLGRELLVTTLEVGGYADAELSAVLARAGVTVADLPPRVREFVRNPRVCAIAVDLLEPLTLQPDELAVERLLLEYWHWRVRERGNLVGHTITDFHKLLRSHARAWRERPKRAFDRDDWTAHSGAATRRGLFDVQNDLSEIEEGRFLQVSTGDRGTYEFRPEVLPFALGLLINAELQDGLRDDGTDPSELLDRVLEPVRGFDFVADIVAAAVGLACLDASFPEPACRALIRGWLELQNVDEESGDTMGAYLAARPEPFLDMAEESNAAFIRSSGPESLQGLLLARRDHPRVRAALEPRLARWLGQWSRRAQRFGDGEHQAERQAERDAMINAKLAALSPAETRLFHELTTETPEPPEIRLDRLVALALAARPLAPHAAGLVGWSFVQGVAWDVRTAAEQLAWVACLNALDAEHTAAAVRELLRGIDVDSSEPAREGAAIALRLLGDEASARTAEALSPCTPSRWWRRVEAFCDTDPFDPMSPAPSNLDNARAVTAHLAVDEVWTHMAVTVADGDLEMVTPALARFDAIEIVDAMRRVVATAPDRTGLALRQLCWHLPTLSPLLDAPALDAVRITFDRLLADRSRVPEHDYEWALAYCFETLSPHVPPMEQLDRLLALPDAFPLFDRLQRGLESLSPPELERRLRDASSRRLPQELARVLFFASARRPVLTPDARRIVANAMDDEDEMVALFAANVAFAAADPALDDLVLDSARTRTRGLATVHPFVYDRAIAAAIVRRCRPDLAADVPDRFLGTAARELGGDVLRRLAQRTGHALARALAPVLADPPGEVDVFVTTSPDSMQEARWFRESEISERAADPLQVMEDFADGGRRFVERQQARREAAEAYHRELSAEGASALLEAPTVSGMRELVAADPGRADRWMRTILASSDWRMLRQVRNLGLALSSAYAWHDAETAGQVFRHLKDVRGLVNPVTGSERVGLWEYVLFAAPEAESTDALRRELFADTLDDASLERATIAAERHDGADWLTRLVEQLVGSSNPGDQARGLAIAGLRYPNAASSHLLERSWGPGFLGDVAGWARAVYQRATWVDVWFGRAADATDPVEFWRWTVLAEGIADVRALRSFEASATGEMFARFGAELSERLRDAGEKRTKRRRDTLFGFKAPDRDLTAMLRDRLSGDSSPAVDE